MISYKLMNNNIDRILKFIDNNQSNEVADVQSNEVADVQSNEVADVQSNEVKYDRTVMRNIKKINTYPNVIFINGSNKIINNEAEKLSLMNQLETSHKEQIKANRKLKLKSQIEKSNISKLKVYNKKDNDISEQIDDSLELVYNSPKKATAIKIKDKSYEIPKTDAKDRKKIYKEISKNKDNLKKLIKEQDKERFNELSMNSIEDESIRSSLEVHNNNVFNKDNTWNRNELLKLLNKDMIRTESNNNINVNNESQYHGFNPRLFNNHF